MKSSPDLATFAVAVAAAACASSDVCAASSALRETAAEVRRKSGAVAIGAASAPKPVDASVLAAPECPSGDGDTSDKEQGNPA